MADGVKITWAMNLKPEFADAFCSGIGTQLPDTRKFPGCRSVNVYRQNDEPSRVILIEEWDSKEDYQKYLAWRNEDGSLDGLKGIISTPSEPEYWTLVA